MDLKIKPEYANVIIGFKNSGIPLGNRSQEDLQFLATKVKANPTFAKYFESLPSEKELLDAKGEAFLEKTKPLTVPEPPATKKQNG